VTSNDKRKILIKRKGVHQQVYRKRGTPVLAITDGRSAKKTQVDPSCAITEQPREGIEPDHLRDEEPKRKKPTPTNSAAAAEQRCLSQ
jgi:hypothetical protein